MQYSREHTHTGHSEYQDKIMQEITQRGIFGNLVEAPDGMVFILVNPKLNVACSIAEAFSAINPEETCAKMNEFLGMAYRFFFGTDFDGPVE